MKPGYQTENKQLRNPTWRRQSSDSGMTCYGSMNLRSCEHQGLRSLSVLSGGTRLKAEVCSNGQFTQCPNGTAMKTTEISKAPPNESKQRLFILSLLDSKEVSQITCVWQKPKGRPRSGKAVWGRRDGFRYGLIGGCQYGDMGDGLNRIYYWLQCIF